MKYRRRSSAQAVAKTWRLQQLNEGRPLLGLPPITGWHLRKEPFLREIARFPLAARRR